MRVDRGIDRGGKQLSPRCPRGTAATKFLGDLEKSALRRAGEKAERTVAGCDARGARRAAQVPEIRPN
jgi:hypothetical protein